MEKEKENKFSKEAIDKAVLHAVMYHPVSLCFLLIGMLGLVGMGVFGFTLLTAIAAGAGIALYGISFGINKKVRGPIFENEYIEKIKEKILEQNKNKLKKLEEEIKDCVDFTGGFEFAVQTQEQFENVRVKFDKFREILNKKLYSNELSYGEFYNTSEQVCGAVLDNIEKIVLSLNAVDGIDIDYLERRFDEIEDRKKAKKDSPHDHDELKAIQESIDLREKKLDEIDKMLSSNERALTELDKITFKISEIKTRKGHSNRDLDDTLNDLSSLTQIAGQYETK
jgi:hypothetical protein